MTRFQTASIAEHRVEASIRPERDARCRRTARVLSAGRRDVRRGHDLRQREEWDEDADVDCGGPGAPKCPPDKPCREATDCVWGFCTANVCERPLASGAPGRLIE